MGCNGTIIENDDDWLIISDTTSNEFGFYGYTHLYDACGVCGGNSVGVCVSVNDNEDGKYCIPFGNIQIPNILDYTMSNITDLIYDDSFIINGINIQSKNISW